MYEGDILSCNQLRVLAGIISRGQGILGLTVARQTLPMLLSITHLPCMSACVYVFDVREHVCLVCLCVNSTGDWADPSSYYI